MKFKGKVALWFWLVMLFGETMVIMALLTVEDDLFIGIGAAILFNIIFIPIVFRNYVEVADDKVTIVFGFMKESMPILEIVKIYRTSNPISSTAASLDRIVIKGIHKQMMCSVQDKENFFAYLKEKNPTIYINYEGKEKSEKKNQIVGYGIGIVVLILTVVLLFTGNIRIEYEDTSFTIQGSYWSDLTIDYDEIESMEYRDEKIDGSRTGGFGSPRLLMGNFKNSEFGNYTRYTYTNCEAGVVLTINRRKVVISGKDEESTREIYDELVIRCQN